MIQTNIRKLVQYGLQTGLITEADKIYTTNRLLELFQLDELEDGSEEVSMSVEVEEWDSLAHVMIIGELEEKLGLSIPLEEAVDLTGVRELLEKCGL